MQRPYAAILHNDRLTWRGDGPDSTRDLHVLARVDVSEVARSLDEVRALLAQTRGAMGAGRPKALDAQLEALRAAWDAA